MSTTDATQTSTDIEMFPMEAPLRGRKAKAEPSPVASAPSAASAAPAPGYPITIYVGTPTPVVVTFPSKGARDKAAQQLIQRATKLPTTFTVNGVTTTFLYITHFTYEG